MKMNKVAAFRLASFWYNGIRFSGVSIDPVMGDAVGEGFAFRLNSKGIRAALRQARAEHPENIARKDRAARLANRHEAHRD